MGRLDGRKDCVAGAPDIVERVRVHLMMRADTYTLSHPDLAELVRRAERRDAAAWTRFDEEVIEEMLASVREDVRAAAASERAAGAHAFWGRVLLWWLAFVASVEMHDFGAAFIAGLLGVAAP